MARIRIALVEDDAAVRIALARLLRLANYEVCPFASGEEFLAAVGEWMPDCAVLDVHLPGLSGIQVGLRLRSGHMELPVVFVTASEDPALDRAAFDAGGLRVLRKPFTNDELLASIASVLPPPAGSMH